MSNNQLTSLLTLANITDATHWHR